MGGEKATKEGTGEPTHRRKIQFREIGQDAVLVQEELERRLHFFDVGLGDEHGGDADANEAGWVGRLAVVRER